VLTGYDAFEGGCNLAEDGSEPAEYGVMARLVHVYEHLMLDMMLRMRACGSGQ